MKIGKYIISTFLLGIYCLAVFHNFIPHFHVDHGPSDRIHEQATAHHHHSHGHTHSHSHHDEEATDLDGLDLIFSLFGHLGHSSHADSGEQHFENYTVKVQQRSLTKLLEMTPSLAFSTISLSPTEYNPPFSGDSPPILSETYLSSRSLRGPPSCS